MDNLSTYNKNQKSICPISGLSILEDDDYLQCVVGEKYKVSFKKIGDRILYITPIGDTSNYDMAKYYQIRNRFVKGKFKKNLKIVEIRDYTNITGTPSRKNRLIQRDNLASSKDQLLAFIMINAPWVVKLVFRVGSNLHKTSFPFIFVSSYKDAVDRSVNIIHSLGNMELFDPDKFISKNEWTIEFDGFSVEYRIFPGRIFFGRASGYLKREYVKDVVALENTILKANFYQDKRFYRIIDYSMVSGGQLYARVLLAKEFHAQELLVGLKPHVRIIVGATPFVQISIRMHLNLLRQSCLFCKTLSDGFATIKRLESSDSNFKKNEDDDKYLKSSDIDRNIRDVIEYIGGIAWDNSDEGRLKDIPFAHPFRPIFDALAVVKLDAFTLLEEYKKVGNDLAISNKQLQLDMIKRKKAESERKLLEEELRQSEKMRAIGQLAGGIAHDFNNQLTGIMGYAELLIKRLENDSKNQAYAHNIVKVTKRAGELTQKLLAFARKGKYQTQLISLHEIIEEVMSLCSHSFNKHIELKKKLNAKDFIITGDSTLIQNMFLNLAFNARDAMSNGGCLTVFTQNSHIENDKQEEFGFTLKAGDYCKISFSDTGEGINDTVRASIFEPFFTTKKKGKGTGMGLAAVYGTIKNHNGMIRVDKNDSSSGTVFSVYLPLATETKDC